MNDRELLELAAKAAGYSVEWIERRVARIGAFKQMQHERRDGFVIAGKAWNPLTDDGDALRLANKLSIDILHNWESITAQWELGKLCREKCTDETRDETTRRAITRAAAEIGKAMP